MGKRNNNDRETREIERCQYIGSGFCKRINRKMCDKQFCACQKKIGLLTANGETVKRLELAYAKFSGSESTSALKRYLSSEIFETLKTRRTRYGSTLMDVIQSGLANPDSNVGLYAPDPDAYKVFADLFDPVIADYHGDFTPQCVHPNLDWGDVTSFGDLDLDQRYVVSTRIRCARSINGYPFNPIMNKTHYREIEEKVRAALTSLEGELKGTYYPLETLDEATKRQLIENHFLFKEDDRFLEAAQAYKYWPIGRGIFFNESKTFLVWCNEEDHMRLISMETGGNLASVYDRLVNAVGHIERKVEFSRDKRLGFLTFCPTNLGTTIRASVHIRLPKLSSDYSKFQELADTYGLQVRGTGGEHTVGQAGIFDVSNKRRLGLTEYEALTEMKNGIISMIESEKHLETNNNESRIDE